MQTKHLQLRGGDRIIEVRAAAHEGVTPIH
jgi:hypothetical protein